MRYDTFQEENPGIWVYIRNNYLDLKDFELSERIEKIYGIRLDPEKIRNIRRAADWKKREVENGGDFERVAFIGDFHIPDHDEKLVSLLLGFLKFFKPHKCYILGDFIDCYPVSKFCKRIDRMGKLQEELDIAIPIIDQIQKIVEDITFLEGNHECFDTETQILTSRGWKKYDRIVGDEKVATYNQFLNCLEWQEIIAKEQYVYKGKLFHLTNRHTDLFISPEHRLLYKPNLISKWRIKPLDQIPIGNNRLYIRCSSSFDNEDYDIKDEEIKIVAWLMTDGSINRKNEVWFYQRKSKVHKIVKILDELKWSYNYRERNRKIKQICGKVLKSQETQCEIRLNKIARDKLRHLIYDKYKIPIWTHLLSDRQFDIFLSSLLDGDGSRHKSKPESSWMLYGKKDILEQIQTVCFSHNLRTSISIYRGKHYRLNITPNTITSFDRFKNHITPIDYHGVIWDVTTPNDTIIVKRNNKISITGNSRIATYLQENPALFGLKCLEMKSLLGLKERGIKSYPYKHEPIEHHKFQIHHGAIIRKHSGWTAKALYERYGGCGICGHSHRGSNYIKRTRQGIFGWYENMCMCKLDASYGDFFDWHQGWSIAYFTKKDLFHLEQIPVIKHEFLFQGKLFSA